MASTVGFDGMWVNVCVCVSECLYGGGGGGVAGKFILKVGAHKVSATTDKCAPPSPPPPYLS